MRQQGVHRHGEMGRDPPSRPRRRPEQARRLPRVQDPLEDPPAASSTTPSRRDTAAPSPGGRRSSTPSCGVVHQILEDDKKAPKKQRHTAVRVFRAAPRRARLRGRLTVVKDAVRAWRRRHAEVFVPLAHPPGEAQVDFGEAEVTLDGQATKVAVFVMTLPYSDAVFCCAFPRECTEAFLEGHVRAFGSSAACPAGSATTTPRSPSPRSSAAATASSPTRSSGSRATTCSRTTSAWCGGPTRRGTSRRSSAIARRNFLVPGPGGARRPGGAQRPARGRLPRRPGAAAAGQADGQGRAARRGAGRDAARCRPRRSLAARVEQPTRRLAVAGPVRRQRLLRPDRLRPPQAHRRRDGRHGPHRRRRPRGGGAQAVLGPRAGDLRPGALPGAAWSASPGRWTSPRPWRGGSCRSASACSAAGSRPSSPGRGPRRFIKVLRLLEWATLPELTRRRRAGAGAGHGRRRRGAADPRAPARRSPSALFCLDGRPHLQLVGVPTPDLSAYASLTAGVAP